jgi:uncharacterized protein DUF4136
MAWRSRLAQFGALAMMAAIPACAATMKVNSYTERAADFSHYRTYAFGPTESVSTGDPRLDSNPFFYGRVQTAVDKQLAAIGYEKTAPDRSDLLIHFHASLTQEINTSEIDRQYGYCTSSECRPFVYDAGTLLLDLVDARTNKLVWRGWAEGSMEGVVDNQAWMEQTVDDAVSRILARLPHRS